MLFKLTILYLFLEFGRPQELIPVIGDLRLPGLVTGLLLVALILHGRIDFSDKQTRLFVLLLMFMAVHVPLAANNFFAFQTLKYMSITFAVYLGIVLSVGTPHRFRTLIKLWLAVLVVLAIHGIAVGGRGVGGFVGDENDFAMAMNSVAAFPFFLALSERNRIHKAAYFGLTGLFVLANMFSFSRGGFVGLLAVGLYCWLRSPRKLRSAVVIVALGLLVSLAAREGYLERLQSAWEEGVSAGTGQDRFWMWQFGWAMFLDNPVIGVGQGNFPVRFGDYEGEERLHGRTRVWRAAHSLYLTLLPELGLVGSLIYFGMLYRTWKDLATIRRSTPQRFGESRTAAPSVLPFARALEASLIGFLVSSIFISTLYYPTFWVTMGFVVALRRIVTTLQVSPAGGGALASDGRAPRRAVRSRPRTL